MTPKSLLRHKRVVSDMSEMATGSGFHRVLWDDAQSHPGSTVALAADAEIARVILCSGKVYYDLLEEREKRGETRIQLLRIEQLYPFPSNALVPELDAFSQGGDRLVPGRAEEPGRVDISSRRTSTPRSAEAGRNEWPRYIGRAPLRLHGGGPARPAQCRTPRLPRRGDDVMNYLSDLCSDCHGPQMRASQMNSGDYQKFQKNSCHSTKAERIAAGWPAFAGHDRWWGGESRKQI